MIALLLSWAAGPFAPADDAQGDPLPPHAVARVGTARFRVNRHVQLTLSPDAAAFAGEDLDGQPTLFDGKLSVLDPTGRADRRVPPVPDGDAWDAMTNAAWAPGAWLAHPRESVALLREKVRPVPGKRTDPAALVGVKDPEARRRLERLVAGCKALAWAVEALDRVATPDARVLLGEWSKGNPDARLTAEANAALGRRRR